MISPEILNRLVPNRDPETEFSAPPWLRDIDSKDPSYRIARWSFHLRSVLHRLLNEGSDLSKEVDSFGFIGTGIFPTSNESGTDDFPDFPIVKGYQFGAALFRAKLESDRPDTYRKGIDLEPERTKAPIVNLFADFTPHISGQHSNFPEGYVAALFRDQDGVDCGITAGHVVDNLNCGQLAPIICSACGAVTQMRRKAPGLIDAAVVEFTCGGPNYHHQTAQPGITPAIEGSTVQAHFGLSGRKLSTVAMALQTPTQIISAATPKHFLITEIGQPGDSGSLVSTDDSLTQNRALVGIYLGKSDCEDEHRNPISFGYALDMEQATNVLRVNVEAGEFND